MKNVLFAAILAAFSTVAIAETYHVTVWNGLADCSGGQNCMFNADKADIPVPTEAALAQFDFTTDDQGLNWAATPNFNTYGDFLDNGQISGFAGTGTLADFLSTSMSVEGNHFASYFAITGSYDSASDFSRSIMHDDGASLYVDGNNIFNSPGRVGQATGGNYNFSGGGSHQYGLFYVAADGGPAVLDFNMPDSGSAPLSVPEPATLALLGLGLVGLGFARRRQRT